MENRIEINGVWYVREDQVTNTPVETIELDATAFNGRVYESDLYCFEATQILNKDGLPYDDVCDIEITDKRVKPWKVEHIDNPKWFIGVLDNNPESMDEAREMFCKRGLAEFRFVVQDLINVGWLNK